MSTIAVRKLTVIQLALCVVLGAAIWIVSPLITGRREAWDNGLYYTGGLLIAGFIGGFLDPPRCWLAAVGVFIGQLFPFMVGVLFSTHPGPLWIVGLLMALPLYTLVSLFGACLGAGAGVLIRAVLRKMRGA